MVESRRLTAPAHSKSTARKVFQTALVTMALLSPYNGRLSRKSLLLFGEQNCLTTATQHRRSPHRQPERLAQLLGVAQVFAKLHSLGRARGIFFGLRVPNLAI